MKVLELHCLERFSDDIKDIDEYENFRTPLFRVVDKLKMSAQEKNALEDEILKIFKNAIKPVTEFRPALKAIIDDNKNG